MGPHVRPDLHCEFQVTPLPFSYTPSTGKFVKTIYNLEEQNDGDSPLSSRVDSEAIPWRSLDLPMESTFPGIAHVSNLAAKLDFGPEKSFQDEVRRSLGKSVHHHSSSHFGSFFLLATFWHYTFRLTEESVALVLQACLGGSASGSHVNFQSERHFRFSVSYKAVGFMVYLLRRVIGSCFDTYFHLWCNGVTP